MTKIKICGITNYKDAINAAKLGVDYLGFNFYKLSSRYINPTKAKKIIEKLPDNVKKVGIFVNEEINKIKSIADFCNLDLIQLSGDEDKEFLSGLIKILKISKISNKKVIKSFRVKNKSDFKNIKHYKVDYIMLDSFKEGVYGGTGTSFDLDIVENVDNKKLFLSGGMNKDNVKSAIEKLNPFAVDVCSSIEINPGKKDFNKMKQFIEAIN